MNRFVAMAGSLLVLLLSSLITHHSSLSAQDDKARRLKVRWYGQSMFQVETSAGTMVVFDPHAIPAFAPPRLTADITLISHPHNDHNLVEVLKEKGKVFEGVKAGKGVKQEWVAVDEKVGTVRVRSLGTFHDAVNGTQRGKSSVWIVEADGLVVVHLGDLGHELSAEQVKAVGKVDVLMVPVGGIYTLNGDQAKRVVEQLKPRLYVLPMHYGVPDYDELLGPDEFFDGQKNLKKMTGTNELEVPLDLKADAPTVVQLGWTKPVKKADPGKEPEKK